MKITICGCGNAAQLMAALITSTGNHQCFIYAPFQDEAARFRDAIKESPNHQIEVLGPDENHHMMVTMDATKITEDPKLAITDADLIILPLPAFAIAPTFKAIAPFVKPGAYLGVLPGQGGFQWAAQKAFPSSLSRSIILFASEKLPYNVRIIEYGRRIRVFSYKRFGVGAIPAESAKDVVNLLNANVPYTDAVPLKSILVTTLTTGNQCIHPVRVRSLHRSQPFSRNPLFYEEMDDVAADDMQKVSDEISAIAKGIEGRSSVILKEVLDVRTALIEAYGKEVEDSSTLLSTLRTTKGFRGIYSPMKQEDGAWVVDFKSRYVSDDIPYGLCVLRGIAELVGVQTPTIDSVITWAQQHMNKSYLVNGKLAGDDVKNTGAPQAFGYVSLTALPEID